MAPTPLDSATGCADMGTPPCLASGPAFELTGLAPMTCCVCRNSAVGCPALWLQQVEIREKHEAWNAADERRRAGSG